VKQFFGLVGRHLNHLLIATNQFSFSSADNGNDGTAGIAFVYFGFSCHDIPPLACRFAGIGLAVAGVLAFIDHHRIQPYFRLLFYPIPAGYRIKQGRPPFLQKVYAFSAQM
jgi:hypothetical protein